MVNTDILLTLIVGITAILLAMAFIRHNRLVAGGREPAPSFHAVAVRGRPDACTAARALEGARFLSREAPALPLSSCTHPRCQCIYQHFDDRRDRERRDSRMSQFYTQDQKARVVERRRQRGRRHDDTV